MESVAIGNGVTTIGDEIFRGCTNLKSVTLNSNAITSANYTSKKNICNIFGSQVTEYILGEDVTEIGEYAFYGCKNITSVSFSDNLNKISHHAFSGCEGLKTIVLTNNVTEIGNNVFEGCSNMETITLSKDLSTIGGEAFKKCKSLLSIEIPYTLTAIGIDAFVGCEKLEKVIVRDLNGWCKIDFKNRFSNPLAFAHHYYINENTEIEDLNIPEGIGSIGKYAFYGASFIKSCVIPKDIKEISSHAFRDCESLRSLSLAEGVESINEYAFYYCKKLEVVEIPNSVTSIDNNAFGATNLNSLYVSSGVTSIGQGAFMGVTYPIKTIWFSNNPPSGYANAAADNINYVPSEQYKSLTSKKIYPYLSSYFVVDGVKYVPISPSERTCDVIDCCYDNTSENINIGKEVIHKGVPMTVKNINSYAFTNNTYTKKVNLEQDGNISDDAFQYCTNIEELNIANNGGIGAGAFRECRGLKNVTIDCSDDIGVSAFIDSDIHGTLKISNRGNIQSLAFNHVTGEYKAIVDNKGEISDNVFLNSTGLKDIIIGEDVTKLGYRAFYGCTELDSITIGSRVETIGKDAFYNCKKITKIVCRATTPPVCDVMALDDINKWNCTLSVPKGSLAAYQQAPQWKEFFFINDDVTPPTPVTYMLIYVVDGIEYKIYEIEEGATITPEPAPTKEGYTFSGWSEIPATMPAHDVTVTGSFTINKYKLTYKVDGAEYKSYELEYGTKITPEPAPTKEGYTFSGWSEIPATMPAHDVTVTGTFAINKYKLIYKVDSEVYKTLSYDYGATITPEPAPTKEGYTFSGWSEIPETMPAHDVTVTGTFAINKYKLVYKVDGEVYKTLSYNYGATITPEPAPTREGYTFSGWSEIPATMPAHDVTVTGTFSVNKYKLTYMVDGEVYKTLYYNYGATITPEPAPTKEGYTFSGWSEIPATMPAYDVTVTGSFTKGAYKLTYMVDGEIYKTMSYDYGATITPEPAPTKEGYTFLGWSDIPETMPAHDVTVTGTFTINKYKLIYKVDGAEYQSYELEYGATITPEPAPTKEGYTFSGWSEIPTTMPAHDVTVTGTFVVNQYTITYIIDNEVYTTQTVDYGSTIIPPTIPEREGYDFAWGDFPETMPAYDITIYGTYTTGVEAIMAGEVDCQIFSLDGKPLNELQKGVNIVRMNNRQIRKVVVR